MKLSSPAVGTWTVFEESLASGIEPDRAERQHASSATGPFTQAGNFSRFGLWVWAKFLGVFKTIVIEFLQLFSSR